MDKKKSKKKTIKLNKTPLATKLGGKSYYMDNKFCTQRLDSNFFGEVFLNQFLVRNFYQKWEYIVTDTPGIYYLKNVITGLFLTSNQIGDLYTTIFEGTAYQKWKIMATSEKEIYVFINYGNEFVLDCNVMNMIYLNKLSSEQYEDAKTNILYFIYQNLPKK